MAAHFFALLPKFNSLALSAPCFKFLLLGEIYLPFFLALISLSAIAFPFFLLSMVLLSGVFTLGIQFKENNWTYVFISIITSALIFYLNDFSAALGKTEKLPVEVSVWMPITIIFMFATVGLIHANQK